ncbi:MULTISPECIES: hypothetical protein [unclassified Coleofasciculus]|uniref:hypothetical protein n=1 Tax=unclassified Coleofasciculus TaxID=2692782 RepID=UPI001D1502DA|nr:MULTISPECIES: hypothetical protein [unclassified Coleofasciculus]
MNITESLQGVTRLFLNTAPVIYYIERSPQYFALASVVRSHSLIRYTVTVTG